MSALFRAALRNDQAQLARLLDRAQPEDWQTLARLAEYHQVVPFLWSVLRSAPMPPAIAQSWRTQFYETALANDARLDELSAIYRELAPYQIEPIVLKGMALAPTVYPSLATRVMGDIDLLVQRQELATMWAVLSARGYLLAENSARYWRLQFRSGGELRLHNVYNANSLEVHWWLWAGEWARMRSILEDQSVWQRSYVYPINDTQMRRLDVHDEVLYIAFHAVISNQCGAGLGRMLLDLDLLIKNNTLDWPKLFARARYFKLTMVLWLALYVLEYFCATALPSDWQKLASSPLRQAAILRLIPPQRLLNGLDPRFSSLHHYGLLALLYD